MQFIRLMHEEKRSFAMYCGAPPPQIENTRSVILPRRHGFLQPGAAVHTWTSMLHKAA
jgi:hypothetical protein